MNLILVGAVSDAKKPYEFLGDHKVPVFPPFHKGVFRFCLSRDRWDKEFAKLQAG